MSLPAQIVDSDLPALFRSADSASVSAQKAYLSLVRADLVLIVLSTAITSWAVSSPDIRSGLAIAAALVLVAGLILTGFIMQTKHDKNWFAARAVAESVKTMSWRYMTGAEPYRHGLNSHVVDALFCRELEAILQERRAIGSVLGGEDALGDQITDRMCSVRAADLDTRKAVYLRDRIRDQRAWYARKAGFNSRLSNRWLLAVGLVQLFGAGAAIALVRWSDLQFNAAAVCAALAAGLLAWLQLKQHQELAHSYGLAAHELGLIEAKSKHVHGEDQLSSFVADAESAISREHTMWTARRDTSS